LAQDDYYYEIQLTNKQLVFYFMAGATGLILSFLAGVMVGRGVDTASGEVQASRPPVEERVVEETPAPVPPGNEDLTYAKRLEGDKLEDTTDRPKAAAPAASKPAAAASGKTASAGIPAPAGTTTTGSVDAVLRSPAASASTSGKPVGTTSKPPVGTSSKPPVSAPGKASAVTTGKVPAVGEGGAFTIQVGAFKDGASAESVVSRLKAKGFAAYVMSPNAPDGLFNVRVGSYHERPEAERVQIRLRDQEKFKPFIVTK
jgi:cell division septation protein DedD